MKRQAPKNNIRTDLGLSQSEFADLLQVSKSMVSMEEHGSRNYPHPAFSKNVFLLIQFSEAEPGFPKLDLDNALEVILNHWKDSAIENSFSKWYEKMERKKSKVDLQIKRLNRKLIERKIQLERAWKAVHFWEILRPGLEKEFSSEILNYFEYKNKRAAENWAFEIAQMEWERKGFQTDSDQMAAWLEKYKPHYKENSESRP